MAENDPPAYCVDCGAAVAQDGRCELCYERWAYLTYQRTIGDAVRQEYDVEREDWR